MKPAAKVTIELDAKWVLKVRSHRWRTVMALQGLAVCFAPLVLLFCGRPDFFPQWLKYLLLPASFAIIIFVSFSYFELGTAVIRELNRIDTE